MEKEIIREKSALERPRAGESAGQPEVARERPAEKKFEGEILPEIAGAVPAPAPPVKSYQERRHEEIDRILADGLNEIYLKMSPAEQRNFRRQGEETVKKIAGLLNQTRIRIDKIIGLIRDWLKLIPGVNRFFIEQEAKIKADRIIKMKDKF